MPGFQLNDDDVVLVMSGDNSFAKTPVAKVSQLRAGLYNIVKPFHPHWIDPGLTCEVLKVAGGGWQKGKIRITLEFIPDEPPNASSDEVS